MRVIDPQCEKIIRRGIGALAARNGAEFHPTEMDSLLLLIEAAVVASIQRGRDLLGLSVHVDIHGGVMPLKAEDVVLAIDAAVRHADMRLLRP